MRNGALITYRAMQEDSAHLGGVQQDGAGDPVSAQLSSSLCLCGFINYTHVWLTGLEWLSERNPALWSATEEDLLTFSHFSTSIGRKKGMGVGSCSVRILDLGSHFEIIFNDSQCQEEACLNTIYQFFSGSKGIWIQNAFLKVQKVFSGFSVVCAAWI